MHIGPYLLSTKVNMTLAEDHTYMVLYIPYIFSPKWSISISTYGKIHKSFKRGQLNNQVK